MLLSTMTGALYRLTMMLEKVHGLMPAVSRDDPGAWTWSRIMKMSIAQLMLIPCYLRTKAFLFYQRTARLLDRVKDIMPVTNLLASTMLYSIQYSTTKNMIHSCWHNGASLFWNLRFCPSSSRGPSCQSTTTKPPPYQKSEPLSNKPLYFWHIHMLSSRKELRHNERIGDSDGWAETSNLWWRESKEWRRRHFLAVLESLCSQSASDR